MTEHIPYVTAYPLAAPWVTGSPFELADHDGESPTCLCGNTSGDEGFSAANPATGKFMFLSEEPPPSKLCDAWPDGLRNSWAICNACGRVYIDEPDGDMHVPVAYQYDADSALFKRARDRYVLDLEGGSCPGHESPQGQLRDDLFGTDVYCDGSCLG